MKIVTQRDLIKVAAKRWQSWHQPSLSEWSPDKLRILEKLKKLDLNKATAIQVNKIIGDNHWTTQLCDECGKRKPEAVCFGYLWAPYYVLSGCVICFGCLGKAANRLQTSFERRWILECSQSPVEQVKKAKPSSIDINFLIK
jgi:hypothetical protein